MSNDSCWVTIPVIRINEVHYRFGTSCFKESPAPKARADCAIFIDFVLKNVVAVGGLGKIIALYEPGHPITFDMSMYKTEKASPARQKRLEEWLTKIDHITHIYDENRGPLTTSIRLEIIVG